MMPCPSLAATKLGRLIVFEGADEVGKTSLASAAAAALRLMGHTVTELAFPGNEPGTLGAHVYRLHHRPSDYGVSHMTAESQQLLHLAAHFDALEHAILPALALGHTVVLDRFWWSTLAYGISSGADPILMHRIVEIEKLRWGNLHPSVLFLITRHQPLSPVENLDHWHRVVAQYHQVATLEESRYPVVEVNNGSDIDTAVVRITTILCDFPPAPFTASFQETSRFNIHVPLTPAKPSVVYDSYWRFAVARQEIFFRKIESPFGPWTSDPILAEYKFTNAYRASDRVSQFLIKNVQNEGEQSPDELFFRTLVFKTFNRIRTWEMLKEVMGDVRYTSYRFDRYDHVLSSALMRGQRIYSAAYIMSSGRSSFGEVHKHRNHLRLIEAMMKDDLPRTISDAKSMQVVFELLMSYPTVGPFLAYQYAIDLNYSALTNFTEMEFVVPGPGAKDGLRKCFQDFGGLNEADMIRFVTERQQLEFDRLELKFSSLWGRPLQLIDCQNLFCEVDKYARVKHPEVKGLSGRTRIKQRYRPNDHAICYWYPPKWGINELIPKISDVQDL